jgi:hypothetical protein
VSKGTLLQFGRGQSSANPITSEMDLMLKLRDMCGAEGFRYEGGKILALRWDLDGNEIIIVRFEAVGVHG